MNFIVSPGQDTVLIDRGLGKFIAGYAHLYSYDYAMLSIMLTKLGFETRRASINDSIIDEMRAPLHVVGLAPKWQNLNQELYQSNGLIHRVVDGAYEINFKITGFDRDPLTSLIIEARKKSFVSKAVARKFFNQSGKNYNRYSWPLLNDSAFRTRLRDLGISSELGIS